MKLKPIETKDGSYTFYNEDFDDTYHSTTVSAIEEAFVKYVGPLTLPKQPIVLDFCFGLGYNSMALLSKHPKAQITGIEKYQDILDLIPSLIVPSQYIEAFNLLKEKLKNNEINLIQEDAIEATKQLQSNYFDGIMFDPFAPQKCPELWTEEIFEEMYRVLKNSGQLTTYSCAGKVRRAMKAAGFIVSDGPCFGRRAPSTIAIKESDN